MKTGLHVGDQLPPAVCAWIEEDAKRTYASIAKLAAWLKTPEGIMDAVEQWRETLDRWEAGL